VYPPSRLNTSRLPLPCSNISALPFTICFATDIAKLPVSRKRVMRGFLVVSPRYSRIRSGMNFANAWKNTCLSDGDPNVSDLWSRTNLMYVNEGKLWCMAKVKTDIRLPYACARAFSLLSMEPKRISKAAEGDEKRCYCATCIDLTFPDSIQSCAGQPGGNIKLC
jgi:hypothetical protein